MFAANENPNIIDSELPTFIASSRSSIVSTNSFASEKLMLKSFQLSKYIFNITFWLAICLFIFQIYNFVYNYLYNEADEFDVNLLTIFVFLLITLLTKSLVDAFDAHVRKFDALFSRAVSQAGIKERVSYIGTSSKALKELQKDISRATSVWNTYLAVRDQSSRTGSDIKNLYGTFFNSAASHSWRDLVGLPDLFDGHRYKLLTVPKDKNKVLEINVLRHSAPIVNFIQLQIDGKQRTYFGWVGFNEKESDIFMTDDVDLNKLFKEHYEKMFQAYQWLDGDSVIKVTQGKASKAISESTKIVDKVGYWLTAEWAQDATSPNGVELISYGLIYISYDDNKLVIEPNIFNKMGISRSDSKHIDAIKNYKNKLYFDFGYEDSNGVNISGMCNYEFSNGSVDTLVGNLNKYRDWDVHKITGVRISKTQHTNLLKNPSSIERYVHLIPTCKDVN